MATSGLGVLLVDEGLLSEADRRTIKRASGNLGSAFARSVLAMGRDQLEPSTEHPTQLGAQGVHTLSIVGVEHDRRRRQPKQS